ncbi:thioredoxin domain-containing protein 16 isoform 2-T2 [Rhinophrynus dorsalis]
MVRLICLVIFCVNNVLMTVAKNILQELSPDTFYGSLLPGKSSLLYFSSRASPSNIIFLDELQKSVGALQDYGVFVAKVNCIQEDIPKYCAEENAYLFRGTKLVREFPTDALFDVNAIVANVLFVLLYNEVKYITSSLELQNIENATKGKRDVVFVYVRAIGIPEHRSVMEAAFVYGSKYQFVLTTETKLLEPLSRVGESSLDSARLFFIHCKAVTSPTQECHRTLLEQSLTTLSIHRFLKIMDAPLADVSGNPEKISSVHLQLGLPVVLILSQTETYEVDRDTAEQVAWPLLGKAGVGILLREKSDPTIPLNCNIALKRPGEDIPVKYMMLGETRDILVLIENTEDKEYKEKEINGDPESQDDEVAEAGYRDRKRVLPLHLVPSLTDETFKTFLTSTPHSVVLFYMSWEAVSMTFLQSVVDMAVTYRDTLDVPVARVNCADWTGICSLQNITSIPAVKIYQTGKEPLLYTGMMGTEELMRFIMLTKLDCPVELFTMEEAEWYVSGKLQENVLHYHSLSVLGVFHPSMKEAADAFIAAAKSLRGFARTGLYYKENASFLSEKYRTPLPALVFSRHKDQRIYGIGLQSTAAEEIIHLIMQETHGDFPEITVESFPSLVTRRKPLLMLFSDGYPNHNDEKNIISLVRGKYLEPYFTCWLNLNNTPVGYGILKKYFGLIPRLAVLVLIHFDTNGQVFAFPSDQDLTEVNILYWLEMIRAGAELPVYTLSNEDWNPPLPDYDFLGMMDAASPDFAAQKIRIRMKPSRGRKTGVITEGTEAEELGIEQHPPGTSLRGTIPKFIEQEKMGKSHTEL